MIAGHLALATAAAFAGAAIYVNVAEQPAVNRRLEATPAEAVQNDTRASVEQWGRLHAARSAFGIVAALVYLWAAA